MRIGIDSNPLIEKKNWVLGRFNKEDQKIIDKTMQRLNDVPNDFISQSFSDFMNKYNSEQ